VQRWQCRLIRILLHPRKIYREEEESFKNDVSRGSGSHKGKHTSLITPGISYLTTQEIKLSKWLDCSEVKSDKLFLVQALCEHLARKVASIVVTNAMDTC
jgi:hypothetical protein